MTDSGKVGNVTIAFLIGSAVMAIGGIVELFLGVRAEQQQLEEIAKPLTAAEAEEGDLGAVDETETREEAPGQDRAGDRRAPATVGADDEVEDVDPVRPRQEAA